MNEYSMIEDIREGGEFIGFYVLKRCELKEYVGSFRVEVELSDKTGSVPGVIWENAHQIRQQIEKGSIVKVNGCLLTYREMPQARIDKIRAAQEGEYDPESFIPSTAKDIQVLKARVKELLESINDPDLSRLGKLIFEKDQFIKEFTRSPAGMKWHHSYLGGLLEHSVEVAEICNFVAERHPDLNRDLLVLAGLLHDVGKIREYSVTTMIDFTDEGRLEGHIVMGERFVRNMCDRVDNFPGKLKMILSHLMLSHQGLKEFSSPVVPMIPEGFVLYYADEIDSKLNALGRITEKTKNNEKKWSEFVRLLGRFIYVDEYEETKDTED